MNFSARIRFAKKLYVLIWKMELQQRKGISLLKLGLRKLYVFKCKIELQQRKIISLLILGLRNIYFHMENRIATAQTTAQKEFICSN